jgi:hypothetical protein
MHRLRSALHIRHSIQEQDRSALLASAMKGKGFPGTKTGLLEHLIWASAPFLNHPDVTRSNLSPVPPRRPSWTPIFASTHFVYKASPWVALHSDPLHILCLSPPELNTPISHIPQPQRRSFNSFLSRIYNTAWLRIGCFRPPEHSA